MTFSIFLPPQAEAGGKLPVVWYLSGLTCTHANVTEKGEYRAACAEHGLIFVAPDTSPRGDGVPDAEGYDFGQGAGFYVDATEQPWAEQFPHVELRHRRAARAGRGRVPGRHGPPGDHRPFDGRAWRADGRAQLPGPIPQRLGVRADRRAEPGAVGAKGACAAISATTGAWRKHDAVALIEDGARVEEILVDVGTADPFIEKELRPELLEAACAEAGIALTLRRQPGYDHSYYFISTFMAEHLRWHAERLNRG